MPPRDVVLDTTVFVGLLHRARGRPIRGQTAGFPRFWLSSVVAAELIAGTRSFEERRSIDAELRRIAEIGRLLVPNHADWVRAADLIARRTRVSGQVRPRDHFNDVLILVSAAREGAAVVTANVRHFEAWARLSRAAGAPVDVLPFLRVL